MCPLKRAQTSSPNVPTKVSSNQWFSSEKFDRCTDSCCGLNCAVDKNEKTALVVWQKPRSAIFIGANNVVGVQCIKMLQAEGDTGCKPRYDFRVQSKLPSGTWEAVLTPDVYGRRRDGWSSFVVVDAGPFSCDEGSMGLFHLARAGLKLRSL